MFSSDKPFLYYFDITKCGFFDVEKPVTGREESGKEAAKNEDGCHENAANLSEKVVIPHCPTSQVKQVKLFYLKNPTFKV